MNLVLCHQPGDVVYEEDCNRKCTCNPGKGLICEKHSCPQDTKCMVKNGIRACYNTGKTQTLYFVFIHLINLYW